MTEDPYKTATLPAETLKSAMAGSRVPGFYRLTVEQRLALLHHKFKLSEEQLDSLREGTAMTMDHAVNMIENVIGVFNLPLGLGLNFLVNGRDHIVPMVIEEASVIAAVSKSAALIREGGGFIAENDPPIMIGQIQFTQISDPDTAIQTIQAIKEGLIVEANHAFPDLVSHGGGLRDMTARFFPPTAFGPAMLVVHLHVDVQQAMGANSVNNYCEFLGSRLAGRIGGVVGLRILSNLADRRLARASFRIPAAALTETDFPGSMVAERIANAWYFAYMDPYRAATHNKGIFNGIDAAAIALGQDWRALEAGGHAYAARDGQYRPLTRFWLEDNEFCGSIEMPVAVGVVGGSVKTHPAIQILMKIAGVTSAESLAQIFVSVGLAQNLGACRALATEGIQRGHMSLHARSVALSAGVPTDYVDVVVEQMILRGQITVTEAQAVWEEMRAIW